MNKNNIDFLFSKNSYIKYRDGTTGISLNTEFFPDDITCTPKSKYDNVVGQIQLSPPYERSCLNPYSD